MSKWEKELVMMAGSQKSFRFDSQNILFELYTKLHEYGKTGVNIEIASSSPDGRSHSGHPEAGRSTKLHHHIPL